MALLIQELYDPNIAFCHQTEASLPDMHIKTDPSPFANSFSARAVNLVNAGLIVLDAAQDIVLWLSLIHI